MADGWRLSLILLATESSMKKQMAENKKRHVISSKTVEERSSRSTCTTITAASSLINRVSGIVSFNSVNDDHSCSGNIHLVDQSLPTTKEDHEEANISCAYSNKQPMYNSVEMLEELAEIEDAIIAQRALSEAVENSDKVPAAKVINHIITAIFLHYFIIIYFKKVFGVSAQISVAVTLISSLIAFASTVYQYAFVHN
jgi:hypothetical protein